MGVQRAGMSTGYVEYRIILCHIITQLNVNIHDTIQFGIIDHRMSSHLTKHLKYTSAVIAVFYIKTYVQHSM